MIENCYKELNLPIFASIEEVKAAYRELAKIHHPDKGGSERKFLQIKLAYLKLSNPSSKKEHDDKLKNHPFGGDDYMVITYGPVSARKDVYDDIKSTLSRRFGGKDKVQFKFKIDLLLTKYDMEKGANVEIELPVVMICEKCFGFGGTIIANCSNCNGTGHIKEIKKGHFRIPPGTKENEKFVTVEEGIELTGVIELNKMNLG